MEDNLLKYAELASGRPYCTVFVLGERGLGEGHHRLAWTHRLRVGGEAVRMGASVSSEMSSRS